MKFLGAATAAAVPAAAVPGASAASEYDTIEVPSGQKRRIFVESGETFENKLIDITAPGADVKVVARGNDWTVRNVGFKGKAENLSPMLVWGSNGTVENVYLGDGSVGMVDLGPIGIFVKHEKTEGPIEFRNVHVGKFVNNGIYGSPTADLEGGIIHIRDSYFDSNNISQFKIGSPLGTCEVTNTVIRTDNDAPACCPGRGGIVSKRGIWAIDGRTLVEDCDIQGSIVTYPSATVDVQDTRWTGPEQGKGTVEGSPGGEPDLTPPDGVPMSAEEAASGGSGGRSSERDDPGETLTIHGDQGLAGYEFAVGGDLEKSDADGATVDDTDAVDGSTASGHVYGGKDSYAFSGEVTSFSLSAPATVYRNGEEVDPESLDSNTLSVHGDQGLAGYEFSVSGSLERSDADGATIDREDGVSGTTASGKVNGGIDSYEFSGDLTTFEFTEGSATVRLNGAEVDPSAVARRTLSIHGDQGRAEYEFAVGGDLEKSDAVGATVDDEDAVDGTTASGHVWGGIDSYRFSGDLTDFQFREGTARVYLDGEEVDPGAF